MKFEILPLYLTGVSVPCVFYGTPIRQETFAAYLRVVSDCYIWCDSKISGLVRREYYVDSSWIAGDTE